MHNEHHVFMFIKYWTDLYKCYTKSLLKICEKVWNMVFCSQLGPESTWGSKNICWPTLLNIHQSEICFRQKSQTLCRYTFCNVHIPFMWQNNITKLLVAPLRQDACYWLYHLVHAICNQTSSFFQFDYTYITLEGNEKHLEPSPFYLQSCLREEMCHL